MKYGVFDNNNPAVIRLPPSRKRFTKKFGWSVYLYDTFEEAVEYAKNWCDLSSGQKLELNKPIDYSGYGDTLEIREVFDK